MLIEWLTFALKTFTWITLVLIGFSVFLALIARHRHATHEMDDDGAVLTTHLNESWDDEDDQFYLDTLDKKEYKAHLKHKKKDDKKKAKAQQKSDEPESRLFLLTFKGDAEASELDGLTACINTLLRTLDAKHDQVFIKITSEGGYVHRYGLAAAQIARLRDANIHVTVGIDEVAASGGYMMAVVANDIIAAPFAIVGSIGVVASLPNFNRLLKKHDIDYEEHTAGRFKRTLTMFGENTPTGREKFIEEIEHVHELFKGHLENHRPSIDVNNIATGEHWHALSAKALNLVDSIMTSDAYLHQKHQDDWAIYQVKYTHTLSWIEKVKTQLVQLPKQCFMAAQQVIKF